MTDRVPPHSKEDEMVVLGSVLSDKDAMSEVFEVLTAADFYFDAYGKIFDSCCQLYIQSLPVDVVSVGAHLRQKNLLQEVGGAEVIVDAVNAVATSAHARYHADKVKHYSVLRSLISESTKIVKRCYDHEDEAEDILETAEKMVFAISERGVKSNLEKLGAGLHALRDEIEESGKRSRPAMGLLSGFSDLDNITSGFQPGNLITLAARPGMGKTSLALDIVRHMTLGDIPCAFFSLEMTRQEIMLRLLSSVSGVPLFQIRTGRFNDSDWLLINDASEKLYEVDLYLDSSSFNLTPISIRSASRRLASKMLRENKKLGLVVVDYLQLVSSRSSRYESRQTEVADISRSLKAMAIDLQVPVLAISQLNRNTEESGRAGRPRLADLRESGAIEQDSDLVMFIYREGFYKAGSSDEDKANAKLIIAKHRNGPLGEINLHFEKSLTRFYQVDKTDSEYQRGVKVNE